MTKRFKELLDKLIKNNNGEREESKIRAEIISLQFEDDYFMNREKRRVRETNDEVGTSYDKRA